jgi:Xaa-Pro aminopeptidase
MILSNMSMNDLKDFLKQNKIDAIIIPSVDEFFGEYVPEGRNRLQVATGFSGSNGIAVVGLQKSVLLTDGRYLQQAPMQIPSHFEVIDMGVQNLSQYLGGLGLVKIGFLQELHTAEWVQKIKSSFLVSKDVDLIPISCEKIDKILNIDTNYVENLDKIIKIGEPKTDIIASLKIEDAMLICDPASVCWLLNIRGKSVPYCGLFNCYLAVFKDGSYKIINNLYDLSDIFDGCDKIVTDFSQINYHLYEQLQTKLVHQKNAITALKAIKTEQEIAGMKQANAQDSIAITKFIKWIKTNPNTTEIDATAKLLEFRKESPHFIEQSFATIMGAGSNSSIIHYHSTPKTNKIIGHNDILLVDSGGHYNYYGTSDITRTICINKPTQQLKTDYTLVLKGHIAVATAIFKQGTTGSQIDSLARQFLLQQGKDYSHGTGHGVGYYLSVHEGPCSLSKKSNVPLEAGMILSNEPGFYVANSHGIRIENLMVVRTQSKDMLCFETISFVELEHDFIDANMLTNQEKEYIEYYSALCINNLCK